MLFPWLMLDAARMKHSSLSGGLQVSRTISQHGSDAQHKLREPMH